MGFSLGGSSKKTQNTTNNFDNRVAASDDSLAFGGENNTISILDGGAISDSFDFAGAAFDFGGEVFGDAAGLADSSLDYSAASQSSAFEYGDNALSGALDFGVESLDFGGDAVSGALGFGRDSLNVLGDAFDSALSFSENIVDRTAQSLATTTGQVAQASRSDSANTLDTITKYGAGVMVAFFLFLAFKKG